MRRRVMLMLAGGSLLPAPLLARAAEGADGAVPVLLRVEARGDSAVSFTAVSLGGEVTLLGDSLPVHGDTVRARTPAVLAVPEGVRRVTLVTESPLRPLRVIQLGDGRSHGWTSPWGWRLALMRVDGAFRTTVDPQLLGSSGR